MPVDVTSSVPRPAVTLVPANAIEVRSANGVDSSTGSTRLSTGTDSPVRADSSTRKACASVSLPSAGTREPASSRTTSPGTSSRAAISWVTPWRITLLVGVASACSDAIAFSARYSWRNPIHALSTTTTKMKIASVTSPNAADRTPAATSNNTIGDVTWSSRIRPADGCAPGSSSLGPSRARRAAASSAVKPRARSVPSVEATRAASTAWTITPQGVPDAEASTRRDARHQMAWRFWASKKCRLSAAMTISMFWPTLTCEWRLKRATALAELTLRCSCAASGSPESTR